MSYAVFKTGGKQYRVQQGDKLDIDRLVGADVDEEIRFPEVLLVSDGSTTTVGAPVIEGASVTAKVIDQFRGPKGIAFKFKRRKGFHKKKGFRRALTKIEITGIAG
jgi:large subunit ribosomal protein L21